MLSKLLENYFVDLAKTVNESAYPFFIQSVWLGKMWPILASKYWMAVAANCSYMRCSIKLFDVIQWKLVFFCQFDKWKPLLSIPILACYDRIFMNYTDTLNVCSLLLILFSWLDNWIYRFKSLLATYHTFSHSLRQPRSVSFSPAPWLRARMLSIGLFPFNFPSAFSLSKKSFNR